MGPSLIAAPLLAALATAPAVRVESATVAYTCLDDALAGATMTAKLSIENASRRPLVVPRFGWVATAHRTAASLADLKRRQYLLNVDGILTASRIAPDARSRARILVDDFVALPSSRALSVTLSVDLTVTGRNGFAEGLHEPGRYAVELLASPEPVADLRDGERLAFAERGIDVLDRPVWSQPFEVEIPPITPGLAQCAPGR